MPIKIPNNLPARKMLESENIFVMHQTRANTQQIRPLRLLLLNLMPTKITTETQLARLLGNTPLQVELELLMMKSHVSKNTPEEHMLPSTRRLTRCASRTSTAWSSRARRWRSWSLSRWNTGRSCARSLPGARPT